MATFNSTFTWERGNGILLTVPATSASAMQNCGRNQIFLIACASGFNLSFDDTGTNFATASSMYVPPNTILTLDADRHDYFSVYNPGASSINVTYIRASRS